MYSASISNKILDFLINKEYLALSPQKKTTFSFLVMGSQQALLVTRVKVIFSLCYVSLANVLKIA